MTRLLFTMIQKKISERFKDKFDPNDTNRNSNNPEIKRSTVITFDSYFWENSPRKSFNLPKENENVVLYQESNHRNKYVVKMDNLCKSIAINYDNDVSNAEESKQDAESIRASYLNSIEQMRDMLSQLERQIKIGY